MTGTEQTYRVPSHLLDMAYSADHGRLRETPEAVQRVAALILRHLPIEPPGIVLERRKALVEAVQGDVIPAPIPRPAPTRAVSTRCPQVVRGCAQEGAYPRLNSPNSAAHSATRATWSAPP